MVVVAGALAVDPADEPDVEVRVAVELLVEANLVIVACERAPELVGARDLACQPRELVPSKVAIGSDAL